MLNQAVNAADETNRANVQTELEMAVSAVVADWSGARYVNGSNESLEDYMTKTRVESNMNTADYNLKEFELNAENGVTVGYKDKDYNFTVEITSSGNSAKVIYEGNSEGTGSSTGGDEEVEEPENPGEGNPDEEEPPVVEEGENFAEAVTEASHYGDYVEYPIDLNEDGNTTNDWRIFYNDGEHIFIIAADYVKNSLSYLNNAGAGMTVSTGEYSIYCLSFNSNLSTTQDTSKAILFGQTLWTDYSTNYNGKYVSGLLNTNNWTGVVDNKFADCAIGGPTIEMWIASYNAKGYTPLYCNNTNTTGYYVGNTNKPTKYYYSVKLDSNTGYNDTLYYPYKTSTMKDNTECWGYWLSSPSAIAPGIVTNVYYNGRIGSDDYFYYQMSIRPLVCLNSEVKAIQGENDIWKISI